MGAEACFLPPSFQYSLSNHCMAGTERPSLIQNLIPLGWMCLQSGNEKVKRLVCVGEKTDSKTMYREQMGHDNVWRNWPVKDYEFTM